MVRSKKPLALLLTCSVSCMAVVSCSDDEDDVGNQTAGSSSGGMGGKSAGGTSNAGTAGKSNAGSSNGGTAGSGTAGSGTAGTNTAGTAGTAGSSDGGTDAGGAAGEGGMAGGNAGAPTDGGMGGTSLGGAGGEGGEPDVGPHQTPRLEYRFDENAGTVVGDSSGRDLDATLSQAAWTADGRNGAAMALAGGPNPPPQYATVPAGVFDGATAMTVSAWVKLASNPMWARVFDFGGTGTGTATRFSYLALDSNLNGKTGVRFAHFGGTPENEATAATGTVLPLNVWKHLAVTLAANGEQAIYIDGFPAAKEQNTGIVVAPPLELEPLSADSWLGKSRFPDAGFQGAMDDFLVYDRVLSAAEIELLADPKSDYARLPFDEGQGTTSEDVSDRGVDATLVGGATWTTGRVRAGVQLSAAGQHVTLANPLAGCTDQFSIALWVKHLEAGNWSRIFQFIGPSGNWMFLTPSTHDNRMHFAVGKPARETFISSTTTIPVENVWHHVAVTIATDTARLYIDGENVGNVASPVTPTELGPTDTHWLGRSNFPATDPEFKGAFDEVRIMCRALTPDEVKNLAFKD